MHDDRQRRAFALLLAAAAGVAFAPAIANGWVQYDEPQYLLENPVVQRGVSLCGLRWAFTTIYASNWHPLTWLSHMLDWQLFGARPWGHHLVAVLLHAIATALCFLFLDDATGSRGRSAAAAVLFALHPLRVESVAWAAERKDLLCGVFFLAACWAHVARARRHSRAPWVEVFAALALLSKPMAVTLPLALLLLDRWPLRRQEPLRSLLVEKLPVASLCGAGAVLAIVAQSAGGAVSTLHQVGIGTRAMGAVVNLATYLRLTVWPAHLIPLYPLDARRLSAGAVIVSLLLLAAITAAAASVRQSRPAVLTGWAWFCATLLPVLGFVQAGLQSVADRYTYLPHVGLAVAVVWAVPDGILRRRGVACPSAAALASVLAACSFVQTRIWKDPETLFGRTLAVDPGNPIAHLAIGVVRMREGRLEEAEAHLRDSLRAAPSVPQTMANLGSVLARTGRPAESLSMYRRARDAAPMRLDIAQEYAAALARAGRTDQAVAEYQRIASLDAQDAATRLALGGLLRKRGQIADAVRTLREAVALAPGDAAAHATLGVTLGSAGDPEHGVAELEKAARLRPDLPGLQEALLRAREQVARQ